MKQSLIVLILISVGLNGAFAQKKIKTFKTWSKNEVIAHRGAFKAKGLPENSLASLNEAIRLGCYGTEFDVHMTADNILVVHHDHDYAGMDIEKSTYKELQAKPLSNGESIPTLESYLVNGLKQKTTRLILEIKPSRKGEEQDMILTASVIDMVDKLNARSWVDYISFSYKILEQVKQQDPYANVAYLRGDVPLEKLKEDKFYGADYHFSVYKKGEWFEKAKALKLTLNAWTVNNAADMNWLLDNKVEFITTDQPEMLLELIKSRKSK